ncbi:hypothetical protein LTR84_008833 [Exophiala bonariae]|uniref:Uncharacterized protein n=1 Tax=Exophiala bonariae TaxID=1690606 RepID=A0AAV9MVP1_9EURO|nr:hypothetical protein LTR84_008833 [Exophiala bonariae]
MDRRVKIWIIGSIAAAFSIGSSVLNVVFAYHLSEYPVLSALRVLLFVAFAISLLNLASIVCFCTLYVKSLSTHSLGSKSKTWCIYSGGGAAAFISIAISGVTLVYITIKQSEIINKVLGVTPMTLIAAWFGVWGVSAGLQILLFCFLGMWTRVVLKNQRASRLDMDFGRASMHDISRTNTHRTGRSFGSQDITLNSPPRTPVSRGGSDTRRSSSTRVRPGSSRTKLMRPSAKSSLEIMPFPAAEAVSIDSAFDDWDTSSVHYEMRSAIGSSPPTTRGGLATIPGSRPESPANALDGPYLPDSPISSSPPHATTSDTATALGWSSSSPRQLKSSPPSSPPPNFSRPTSSHKDNKPPPKFQKFDPSMDDLIHPLFRPNSPHPPPIATMGTMVTASPMADQLITPKTLARLRSNSNIGSPPPSLPQPSRERSETVTSVGSVPDSPTLGSDGLGSPGPSIVDDLELPPILPGFVLSAGSRSSLVEYGKRKSTKDRPKSHLSVGSRLSEMLL